MINDRPETKIASSPLPAPFNRPPEFMANLLRGITLVRTREEAMAKMYTSRGEDASSNAKHMDPLNDTPFDSAHLGVMRIGISDENNHECGTSKSLVTNATPVRATAITGMASFHEIAHKTEAKLN